jgi:hypothetical protein
VYFDCDKEAAEIRNGYLEVGVFIDAPLAPVGIESEAHGRAEMAVARTKTTFE